MDLNKKATLYVLHFHCKKFFYMQRTAYIKIYNEILSNSSDNIYFINTLFEYSFQFLLLLNLSNI